MALDATNPPALNPLDALRAAYCEAAGVSTPPAPTALFSGHLGARPVLAPGLLPPVIERLAFDAAARMASGPGPVALAALCAASGAIRAGWRIRGMRRSTQWTEPPVLWGAITGGVSRKKTHLLRAATDPLRPIQDAWEPDHARALHEWKKEEARHNAAWARYKSGKGDAPDPLPDAPGLRQIIVNDASIEAIGEIARHNPAGLLLERDELTGWLAGMTAYSAGKGGGGSPARSAYLESWNAGSADIDRVGRGRVRIRSFAVSVIGGIQDEKIRDHFKGDSDGLLARFLFAEAPAPTGIPRDIDDDGTQRADWFSTLHSLANSAVSGTVCLSEEAARVREGIERRAIEIGESDAPDSWKAHAGKWPGVFLRLCLVCHLIEHADTVRAEKAVPEVSGDLAERVARLMHEFFEPEAARIHFSLLNRTTAGRDGGDLETLGDLILRRGKPQITWREVTQGVRALRSADPASGALLLDTLASHAWLSPRQQGPRVPFWIVNPAVFERFRARRRALAGLPQDGAGLPEWCDAIGPGSRPDSRGPDQAGASKEGGAA